MRFMTMALVILVAASGQAAAQGHEKGWVDVNFGIATAAEQDYTSTRVITISQEAGGGAVAYGLPRGASLDVGGATCSTPGWGSA